jgi:hypothetical protein
LKAPLLAKVPEATHSVPELLTASTVFTLPAGARFSTNPSLFRVPRLLLPASRAIVPLLPTVPMLLPAAARVIVPLLLTGPNVLPARNVTEPVFARAAGRMVPPLSKVGVLPVSSSEPALAIWATLRPLPERVICVPGITCRPAPRAPVFSTEGSALLR